MTPTARTLAYLRGLGMTVDVVERTIRLPGGRVFKRDFLGFADLIAVQPGVAGALAVQTTTTSNQAARLAKIALEPGAALWRAAGNRIQVVGWRKMGPRGKRKTWQPSITDVVS